MTWQHHRCGQFVTLITLAPMAAKAHSFGTPYVPPVPFWMYAYGSAATLFVTFAVMGFLASTPTSSTDLRTWSPGASAIAGLSGRSGLLLLRLGAAGCLLLTILVGFLGSPAPPRNLAMTLFWVVFLLAFAYLTLFVGNVYALINPWAWAVRGFECLGLDLTTARLPYPQRLAYWPAFLLYVALIWFELFVGPNPALLSAALVVYSVATFAGVWLFGKATWFRQLDVFSVFFRLIGRLAPVEYQRANGQPCDFFTVRLRFPFSGVLHEYPAHISLVLFVLFMLSSTTYDSIHETALWIGIFWKNALSLFAPLWGGDLAKAQDLLMGWYLIYRQVGLLVFPFLYLALYLLVLLCVKAITRVRVPLRKLAFSFCNTLLPIAIAYHFTHNFPWLVVQAQALLQLLGIEPYSELQPLNMGVIWHTQVAVLLAGHVISVWLSHAVARRTFSTSRQVILSHVPLLILMVVYTISGLWILSLPLGSA